jgi:hypothetical protein
MFSLGNHWARIAPIYKKASWENADLSLYKLLSPRVKVEDTRGETIFTFAYWKEFKKKKKETSSQFQSNLEQTFFAWWEFKFIQMKVEVLFKGGIITKVQKQGRVI